MNANYSVFGFLIISIIAFSCKKLNRSDLIGTYVLDDDSIEALGGRYNGCEVVIKDGSTFSIFNCDNHASNKRFSWRYIEGADFVSIYIDGYSTGWEIKKSFFDFKICWRLDEGKFGVVCFRKIDQSE